MAVEGVVTFFLTKLSMVIEEEASLLLGVNEQVQYLRNELEWIRSFLRDAEQKRKENELLKVWLNQVRDVAYDIEDVIDSFVLKLQLLRGQSTFLSGFMKKCICCSNELTVTHEAAKQIESINKRIEKLASNKSKYGLDDLQSRGEASGSSKGGSSQVQPMVDFVTHGEEDTVVGLVHDMESMVMKLLEGEQPLAVIPIVGMPGIGKTALAKKVYSDQRVKNYFDCHAWVCVSQDHEMKKILEDLIRAIMTVTDKEEATLKMMSEIELIRAIRKCLEMKRYLVVVDDVWKTNTWNILARSFPDTEKGSRVIITTRNKEVAFNAGPKELLHELQCLTKHESQELFCEILFPRSASKRIPSNLQKLGREMVANCGGLPLAVTVLGGLLSKKGASVHEWSKVLKSMRSWQLIEQDQITSVLALSYVDLPYYLKSCFLYFGLFPRDKEIPARKLIRLWVAEGFIQGQGGKTMEEVAEDYLDDLIQRSMIQATRMRSNGGVKTCRIHSLLQEFAISEAKEVRFLTIDEEVDNSASTYHVRRIAIHDNVSVYNHSTRGSILKLRTLLLNSVKSGEVTLRILQSGVKLLRVLDLEGSYILSLPKEIGELIHLRYLNLRKTRLRKLPSSVRNLHNMQTLDLGYTNLIHVPLEIWGMLQLRHLDVYGLNTAKSPQLNNLTNLRTLRLSAGNLIRSDSLSKLTNLRKLVVGGDLNEHGTELSDSIAKLNLLESLELISEYKVPNLGSYFSHCSYLYRLKMIGRLDKLPETHQFPSNLTKLSLEFSALLQDPMIILENLGNLRILRLQPSSYVGTEMVCSAHGFPQLESLELDRLFRLKMWRVEKGAMQHLRHLKIQNCLNLQMIPEGLQHLNNLDEMELIEMPEYFTANLQENIGKDWHKIQHIRSVTINRVPPTLSEHALAVHERSIWSWFCNCNPEFFESNQRRSCRCLRICKC